jgi:hypothetical protein
MGIDTQGSGYKSKGPKEHVNAAAKGTRNNPMKRPMNFAPDESSDENAGG